MANIVKSPQLGGGGLSGDSVTRLVTTSCGMWDQRVKGLKVGPKAAASFERVARLYQGSNLRSLVDHINDNRQTYGLSIDFDCQTSTATVSALVMGDVGVEELRENLEKAFNSNKHAGMPNVLEKKPFFGAPLEYTKKACSSWLLERKAEKETARLIRDLNVKNARDLLRFDREVPCLLRAKDAFDELLRKDGMRFSRVEEGGNGKVARELTAVDLQKAVGGLKPGECLTLRSEQGSSVRAPLITGDLFKIISVGLAAVIGLGFLSSFPIALAVLSLCMVAFPKVGMFFLKGYFWGGSEKHKIITIRKEAEGQLTVHVQKSNVDLGGFSGLFRGGIDLASLLSVVIAALIALPAVAAVSPVLVTALFIAAACLSLSGLYVTVGPMYFFDKARLMPWKALSDSREDFALSMSEENFGALLGVKESGSLTVKDVTVEPYKRVLDSVNFSYQEGCKFLMVFGFSLPVASFANFFLSFITSVSFFIGGEVFFEFGFKSSTKRKQKETLTYKKANVERIKKIEYEQVTSQKVPSRWATYWGWALSTVTNFRGLGFGDSAYLGVERDIAKPSERECFTRTVKTKQWKNDAVQDVHCKSIIFSGAREVFSGKLSPEKSLLPKDQAMAFLAGELESEEEMLKLVRDVNTACEREFVEATSEQSSLDLNTASSVKKMFVTKMADEAHDSHVKLRVIRSGDGSMSLVYALRKTENTSVRKSTNYGSMMTKRDAVSVSETGDIYRFVVKRHNGALSVVFFNEGKKRDGDDLGVVSRLEDSLPLNVPSKSVATKAGYDYYQHQ